MNKIKWVVHGNFYSPDGIVFHDEAEAIKSAKELVKDEWSSYVCVVKHEVIWIDPKHEKEIR